MGVERRVAEPRRDHLFQLLREHVLEHLGLGVHGIPANAEALCEVELEQPVMAQHLQRDPPAGLGEPDTAIALVGDEAERVELAQHPRHRCRTHAEPLREGGRRGNPLAALERIDRLRVVLHGGGKL